MEAALRAGERAAILRARCGASSLRREARGSNQQPTLNTDTVERQLRKELSLQQPPPRRRAANSVVTSDVDNPCNKRLRKPD